MTLCQTRDLLDGYGMEPALGYLQKQMQSEWQIKQLAERNLQFKQASFAAPHLPMKWADRAMRMP